MTCTIQINYGTKEGEGITISNLSDEEIYGKGNFLVDNLQQNLNEILKNSPEWQKFVDNLINYMSSTSAVIKDVTYNDIQEAKDLVPNVNAAYIKAMYPDIEFPNVDVPILLLDNLDRSTKNGVQGRVIDTKGNEIFVIKGDKNSVIKLGKYLTIRERLSEDFVDSLDKYLANELNEVFEKLKSKDLPTKRDLVSDYLNNKKKYKDIKKESGKRSAFLVLEDVANVLNSIPKKQKYDNPLVEEFVRRFTYGFNSAEINLKQYYSKVLKSDIPEVLKLLDINSPEKFIAFINKEGSEVEDAIEAAIADEKFSKLSELEKSFVQRLKNDIDQDEEQWLGESLVNWLQSLLGPTTNPIRYKAKKINKNVLELESSYPTIKSVYGLGYDTVSQFSEVEIQNGYTIYSGAVNGAQAFFFTKGILTPYSYGVAYHTLEEAKEAITNKANKEVLKNYGLFDLKVRKKNGELTTREGSTFLSEGFIPAKSIITSIDMVVSTDNMLNNEYILLEKTLQDFYDYVNSLNVGTDVKEFITNNIDTAEKAAIFLSEVNQRMNFIGEDGRMQYNRENGDVFKAIVTDIKKAPVKYYYIKSSVQTRNEGQRRYYFIETDKTTTQSARTNPRVPIIKFLETLSVTLQNKFGVPVHVVSNDDIIEATNPETIAKLQAIKGRTEAEEEMLQLATNLQGLELDSTVKAFIHNGEIYINSSTANIQDPFHEYAHLILGVLKSNPATREAYIALLQKALSTEFAANAIERKRKLYPNRSYYDLAEEVFADMYGQHMNRRLPYDLNTLFEDSRELKENENNIFDMKDANKPLKEYSGATMISFWNRFNRDVALTLKDNPSFIKGNGEIQMQRRKANWLEQQLRDGKIEENCE